MDTKPSFYKNGCLKVTNKVLQALIDEKGYRTITQFAEKLGLTRQYISSILHGHLEAPEDLKIKIAKALEVDSRTIFPTKQK